MKGVFFCVVGLSIILHGSANNEDDINNGEGDEPNSGDERTVVTEFERAIWNVSATLYTGVNKTEPELGNFVVSPLSLTTCMVMLNAGADGETAKEIQKLFQLGTDSEFAVQNHTEILDSLRNQTLDKESGVELVTASRIFANKNTKIRADYNTAMSSLGDVVYFNNPTQVIRRMNQWVKNQTHGKISKIAEDNDVNNQTAAVLINAIYFKAPWKQPFNISDTKKEHFHISETKSVQVDMMHILAEFPYADLSEAEASAVFLPYKGDRMSMIIYLPWPGNKLSSLEEKLGSLIPTEVRNRATTSEVSLYLPKFNISSSLDFKDILTSLGIQTMFKRRVADFSKLSDSEEFYIYKIRQNVVIEVNEEGTEVAAATGAFGYGAVSATNVMKVDRPFVIQIFDSVTGTVLVTGRIVNPNRIEPVEDPQSSAEASNATAPNPQVTVSKSVLKQISAINTRLTKIEESIQKLQRPKISRPIAAVLYPFPNLQSGEGFPLTFQKGRGCTDLPPDWVRSVYVNTGACILLYGQPKCDGPDTKLRTLVNDISRDFKRGIPKSIKNC